MSRLFKFEIKRMKYKKIHIILPLIIISIGLVGIITGNAFNENLTSKVKMLNIFQAYTQFSFIFLGFVYIYLFTEDSVKGTDKYISQLGYSLAVQILFKSLILYAYTLIITTAFIIGYSFYRFRLFNTDSVFNCSSIIVYDNVRMLNEHNLQKGFRCNSFSISVFYYI